MESKEFYSLVFIGLAFTIVFFLLLGNKGITGFMIKEESTKLILNIEDESGKEIDFAFTILKNDIQTTAKYCYSDGLCEYTLYRNYPSILTITKEGYYDYIKEINQDSSIEQLDIVLIKSDYSDITLSVIDDSYKPLAGAEVYAKTSDGVYKLITNSEGRAYLKAEIGTLVQYSLSLPGYTPHKGYFNIEKPIETNRLMLTHSK
ncbi:MAG TPA: hypothetical protein PLX15_05670 [Candidatus Woesearchaeota archaeon]|nr:hypothetical protein [Candidatus Woesearchaeota archaeon]